MQSAVAGAPLLPGCYIYRDKKGKIIYIGKAKVLRNRVRSYFNNFSRVEEKIQQMISLSSTIEFLVTDSEIEALILEANLIKKYKPKYNSMGTDDKSYVYVKFDNISSAKSKNPQKIPTITVTRDKEQDGAKYFGPYPNVKLVKRLLRRLRKIFPYCTSNTKVTIPRLKRHMIKTDNSKPCFEHQIDLCPGTCVGEVTREEYEHNINSIKSFFHGDKNILVREYERKMEKAANTQDFELAAKYRNMLRDIKYVGSNLSIDKDLDEVVVMKEKLEKRKRAVNQLVEMLEFPREKLDVHPKFRMECYDISNIQGKQAVGSMVVFIDGEPDPSMYRRFRIRMKNEPNDFAMLQEVLIRRFNQYLRSRMEEQTDEEGFTIEIPKQLKQRSKNWKPDESFSQLPDLVIIDGGKGQLSATYRILSNIDLAATVPIVGLAKREEEIFKITKQFEESEDWEIPTSQSSDFTKIKLPKRSEALYLVQRIRDEAHRFAITYHRKLRSKSSI